MIRFSVIFLIIILSGCASYKNFNEDMIKAELEHCQNKKFVSGSTDFQKCRQKFVISYYNDKLEELLITDKIRSSFDNDFTVEDFTNAAKLIH